MTINKTQALDMIKYALKISARPGTQPIYTALVQHGLCIWTSGQRQLICRVLNDAALPTLEVQRALHWHGLWP